MIGQTPVALLITVLVAMWKLGGGRSASTMEKIMDGALGPVCAIILVTGAGGMFGGVLGPAASARRSPAASSRSACR